MIDKPTFYTDCPVIGGPVLKMNCDGCTNADTCIAFVEDMYRECRQKYKALCDQLDAMGVSRCIQ